MLSLFLYLPIRRSGCPLPPTRAAPPAHCALMISPPRGAGTLRHGARVRHCPALSLTSAFWLHVPPSEVLLDQRLCHTSPPESCQRGWEVVGGVPANQSCQPPKQFFCLDICQASNNTNTSTSTQTFSKNILTLCGTRMVIVCSACFF